MPESYMLFLLGCFYFMLPAYFANMAPVIVKKVNFLKIPIDFGKILYNKPIFGKNKTFRGIVFGVLFAVIIAYIQYNFYQNGVFLNVALIDYSDWLLMGFLMGFGAIFGDLVESFIKRQLNYIPGEPFVPFDQIDFVLGALIFVFLLVDLSINKIIVIIILSFVLHIIVNHVAFYMRIRNEKW